MGAKKLNDYPVGKAGLGLAYVFLTLVLCKRRDRGWSAKGIGILKGCLPLSSLLLFTCELTGSEWLAQLRAP